jgi:hypothetical protein
MFIFSYQENANQNYIEILSHYSQYGYPQGEKNTVKGVKIGILMHCWQECKLVQPL